MTVVHVSGSVEKQIKPVRVRMKYFNTEVDENAGKNFLARR